AVGRIKHSGTDQFLAVLGTGVDHLQGSRGRDVVAVDVATGTLVWTFRTLCPLGTDILLAESNDEPGKKYDGYVDWAFFADLCGNVSRTDVAAPPPPDGVMVGVGPIRVPAGTMPYGNSSYSHDATVVLFQTASPNALGDARPIAGTLSTTIDPSNE